MSYCALILCLSRKLWCDIFFLDLVDSKNGKKPHVSQKKLAEIRMLWGKLCLSGLNLPHFVSYKSLGWRVPAHSGFHCRKPPAWAWTKVGVVGMPQVVHWYNQHGSHGLQGMPQDTSSKAWENPVPWCLTGFSRKKLWQVFAVWAQPFEEGKLLHRALCTQSSAQSSPTVTSESLSKKQNAKTWPQMPAVKRLEQFLMQFGHSGFSYLPRRRPCPRGRLDGAMLPCS